MVDLALKTTSKPLKVIDGIFYSDNKTTPSMSLPKPIKKKFPKVSVKQAT